MSRLGVLSVLAILHQASTLPARADIHPNTQSGFAPEAAFQVGELDNVNLFNGNLVVTLPLGPSYPVGGGLSYRLTLVYNANPWYFAERDTFDLGTRTQGLPNPCSNAGLGWRISLGRMNPPCAASDDDPTAFALYEGMDGAMHLLYGKLHEGDPEDPEDVASPRKQKVLYSRDGSYLRARVLTGGWEVEFPDGTVHHFDGSGRLTQIRDRFPTPSHVDIAYSPGLWTIADSQGRVQKIRFRSDLPTYKETLSSVELAGFGGGTSIYTFNYVSRTIARGCPHNDTTGTGNIGKLVSVPFLTGIVLPENAGSYDLSGAGDYLTDPGIGPCVEGSGSLLGMRLPTFGRLEWTYQTYSFPTESSTKPFRTRTPGVATRTVKAPNGAVLGAWQYATALSPPAMALEPHEEMVNTVTDPLGFKTRRYFSVFAKTQVASPGGFSLYEYGLPLTHNAPDGTGRFLSTAVLDAAGRVLRTAYVRYERDQVPALLPDTTDRANFNQRPVSTRTVFNDDANRFADEDLSSFDGLGHYRWTVTGGNFPGGAAANVRQAGLDYNQAAGVYHVDPATNAPAADHTFAMVPSSAAWVLGNVSSKQVVEVSATEFTLYCFESGNGFVTRERRLRDSGTAESPNDVLTVYQRDAGGNRTREDLFGGDVQTLTANGTTCTMALPMTPAGMPASQYGKVHTYQGGVLATSAYTTNVGEAFSFKTLDRTIDMPSGLIASERDVSGLETGFEYDLLGRRTWSKPAPGHGGWTEFAYDDADSSTDLANVTLRRRGNGSKTAPVLAESQLFFDGLGRLWKETRKLPSGATSARETLYDGAGNKASVSELQTGTPTKRTQFLAYDPFGRAHTIQPADGSTHEVKLGYAGTREVSRTVKVWADCDGSGPGGVAECDATTTEHYDRNGRLADVVEPSGANGANVTTTYTYDVGNRLRQVRTAVAGSATQTRSFTYDIRGFLLSETHPEKGPAGNGTVTYSSYDAAGHAGRKVDGPHDLTFVYDRAERVVRVRETGAGFTACSPVIQPGQPRCLKEFDYAAANSGNDLRQGKLVTAKRYNYPVLGGTHTALLTETYAYTGRDGRVSARDTSLTFDGVTNETFTQSFTYEPLGQVKTISYPQCTFAPCSGTAASPRTVINDYAQGLLTGLQGYGTISYHPNLMVNEVIHANGVTDTQVNDPDAMRRPLSIVATSPAGTNLWNTHDYAYDGSGNVKSIGTSSFAYDKVSRLISATLFDGTGGGGNQKSQTYTFDAFGNLQAIGGTSGRNTPTSSATNRLTGPGVSYDAAGNLTSWSGATYEHDAFDQMGHMKSGAEEWFYAYTADDERAWSFKPATGTLPRLDRWTLRDLGGQVLRTYEASNFVWMKPEDYVYRGGQLLAAETPAGVRHFHLDHLGTPRLITNAAGQKVAYHLYYPFGEEATAFNQDAERMKFTGHERDLASALGPGDDLDYMHARFCSPVTGRFLSTDPGKDWDQKVAQSWNLYSYVRNNPMKSTDPTGRCTDPGGSGTRICIQTFISMKSFGGFKGDGRGARSDGGTYRTTQFVNMAESDSRIMISEHFEPGRSKMGLFAQDANVANHEVVPTAAGLNVSAAASDGLLLGAAPNLEYDLTIAPGSDGEMSVSGTHTAFPSVEVWVYEDGKSPQLIYVYEAPADSFFEGLVDINRTVSAGAPQ